MSDEARPIFLLCSSTGPDVPRPMLRALSTFVVLNGMVAQSRILSPPSFPARGKRNHLAPLDWPTLESRVVQVCPKLNWHLGFEVEGRLAPSPHGSSARAAQVIRRGASQLVIGPCTSSLGSGVRAFLGMASESSALHQSRLYGD